MAPNTEKKLMVYCEPCSYKRIIRTGEAHGLVEIKTSPVPTNIPVYDQQAKKTVVKPAQQQKFKFKCPKCGRGVVAKQLSDAYSKSISEVEERERKAWEESEKQKRIEDGKPVKREPPPDVQFSG